MITLDGSETSFNNAGGNLVVESRVSDKIAGDIGHPVQFDVLRVSGMSMSPQPLQRTPSIVRSHHLEPLVWVMLHQEPSSLEDLTQERTTRRSTPSDTSFLLVVVSHLSASYQLCSPRIQQCKWQDTEVTLEYNPSSVIMTNETEMRNFSFLRD